MGKRARFKTARLKVRILPWSRRRGTALGAGESPKLLQGGFDSHPRYHFHPVRLKARTSRFQREDAVAGSARGTASSSNGRTPGSQPGDGGSAPPEAAKFSARVSQPEEETRRDRVQCWFKSNRGHQFSLLISQSLQGGFGTEKLKPALVPKPSTGISEIKTDTSRRHSSKEELSFRKRVTSVRYRVAAPICGSSGVRRPNHRHRMSRVDELQ